MCLTGRRRPGSARPARKSGIAARLPRPPPRPRRCRPGTAPRALRCSSVWSGRPRTAPGQPPASHRTAARPRMRQSQPPSGRIRSPPPPPPRAAVSRRPRPLRTHPPPAPVGQSPSPLRPPGSPAESRCPRPCRRAPVGRRQNAVNCRKYHATGTGTRAQTLKSDSSNKTPQRRLALLMGAPPGTPV